jgi:Protein of unknown function (DUF1614)
MANVTSARRSASIRPVKFEEQTAQVTNGRVRGKGLFRVMIGTDLLNLGSIHGLGAPVASIGGAGTFDSIFLIGIVAVLIASVPQSWRPALRKRLWDAAVQSFANIASMAARDIRSGASHLLFVPGMGRGAT